MMHEKAVSRVLPWETAFLMDWIHHDSAARIAGA